MSRKTVKKGDSRRLSVCDCCSVQDTHPIFLNLCSIYFGMAQHLCVHVCLFSINPVSDMATEVAGYNDVAKQIIDLAVFGVAQNRSYRRLADFTDTIGNRVSGSRNLDMAIKYMYNAMRKDGLDVHLGELALLLLTGCKLGGKLLLNSFFYLDSIKFHT